MTPSKDTGGFTKTILKQKEVPGYDSSNYRCCRVYAPSSTLPGVDSVQIPVSLVFHKALVGGSKGQQLPQKAPVLMSGYGECVVVLYCVVLWYCVMLCCGIVLCWCCTPVMHVRLVVAV